jgi:myo-inositol-1(or 4)-monophosphatase
MTDDASQNSYQADLDLIAEAGAAAGRIAMGYFRKNPKVWTKPGDSPVSEGDYAVDAYLKDTLLAARPDYGWLSEETADDPARLDCERVFIVDPIDGTRAYVSGQDIWCVSIAVVENGRAVAGVLVCPVLEEVFLAAKGGGATLNGEVLKVSGRENAKPVAGPKAMRDAMDRLGGSVLPQWPSHIPSLAYRLAMVAKGDLRAAYARPHSHDWDIAAADIILSEAGCKLCDVSLSRPEDASYPTIFNRAELKRGILFAGAADAPQSLLEVAQTMATHS